MVYICQGIFCLEGLLRVLQLQNEICSLLTTTKLANSLPIKNNSSTSTIINKLPVHSKNRVSTSFSSPRQSVGRPAVTGEDQQFQRTAWSRCSTLTFLPELGTTFSKLEYPPVSEVPTPSSSALLYCSRYLSVLLPKRRQTTPCLTISHVLGMSTLEHAAQPLGLRRSCTPGSLLYFQNCLTG